MFAMMFLKETKGIFKAPGHSFEVFAFAFTPTQRSIGIRDTWQGVKEDEKPKKPAKQAEVALASHFVPQIHPK